MAKRAGKKQAKNTKNGFYDHVLIEAERVLLPQAAQVQGLEQEIALLRVKLATVVQEHPENLPLMLRGVELLIRAVSAEYRLSKKSQDNLAAAIDGVLKEIGASFFEST
jgi:hypothetical protein